MAVTTWLIVESLANWKVDAQNCFSFFGMTRRFENLSDRIKEGDRLISYITGKSAFADIREVTRSGLRKVRGGGAYEIALPFCLDTKPILTLAEDRWIPISLVRDRLGLTSGKPHWSFLFRTAIRKLDPADAALLSREIEARQQPFPSAD